MENHGWSEEQRKAAWSKAGADHLNYAPTVGGIEYIGPVPRVCACGEYHAPGEACAIFGSAFTPRLRNHLGQA